MGFSQVVPLDVTTSSEVGGADIALVSHAVVSF